MITLFYGGDVNIGRTMNRLSQKLKPFVGITEMTAADLRLVNLECVIATKGEQNARINTFFLRARPEQTNVLVNTGIDIVLTANNHAGDYGKEALLEQSEYLNAAGILHTGSGKNFTEAFTPVYKKVGDIILAIFSVDSTRKSSAATVDSPGTAYLPQNNLKLWQDIFADRIREAHKKAHVVIIAPHWGVNNVQRPSEQMKKIGHLLIDLGADAVLGTHAHFFHGVENYKNRPIIYDAGDFLFDSKKRGIGCFTLDISADGVEKVKFIPLVKRPGQTQRAKASAPELQKMFIELCKEFNTPTTVLEEGVAEISFEPPRRLKIINDVTADAQEKHLIEPLTAPRPEWIVDKVPDEAIIPPQRFGVLKLVGYRVPPECQIMTEVKMLYVETYWTIDEPTNKNLLLSIKGIPVRECDMPPYGTEQAHEFLDYMFPTNRWKPGVIYHEKIGLSSPQIKLIANVDLQVEIKVTADAEIVGVFKSPKLIKMKIGGLLYFNDEFDDIIYQSEPGKCWTAEQLAKVTGGKWIVPPPKGWYINSFSRNDPLINKIYPQPTLFLAAEIKGSDSHKKILKNVDKLDGAIIDHEVEGLPPDFPLLKVANSERAMYEIGFAARKRFQGKVIAITGSVGKTTTCNMLNYVLSKENNVKANISGTNIYRTLPWIFASVKQDDAFAVIETSINALVRLRGSITYEITPNVAVVTSITLAHIGNSILGSLIKIAEYKSRIFCGMTAGSYAVLNRDMPYYEIFEEKAKSFKLNIITFGTHPDATVRMPVIADGEEFFLAGKAYKLSCPVPADQIYDALAVVGVSVACGIRLEKTLEYLKTFEVVKGRGNVLKVNRNGKNLTIIDSTFNANPLSMKYALEHLKISEPNQKSRVAILGDIAELGTGSVDYHKGLADAMLAAEPDRILLCGEFMRHPYEMIKDKLNATWFRTLDELLKNGENHLRDGDTVLLKSSHATGLSKVVDLLSKNSLPKLVTQPALNIPKPLFDIKNFLPEGITPENNGMMPIERLKRIHCGGQLYIDAARSWLAMVRAAAQDNIFLNLNTPFKAYRKMEQQIKVFKKRFMLIDGQENLSDDAIRVEFENKIWQLKPNEIYAAVPGTSSHGYGLAVDIQNAALSHVKAWLNKNAAQFGFVREYDFEPWHFTYIKSREGIPARVLETEKLPPEPTYTAEEIEKASGCK
jgi:UDP-N-acetylmuramoyl-tripeptide--D-alanyl-D-alanine ligase